MHALSPSTQVAEAEGQPGFHSEFQDTQGCVEKLCLKKKKILERHLAASKPAWGLGQGSELEAGQGGGTKYEEKLRGRVSSKVRLLSSPQNTRASSARRGPG